MSDRVRAASHRSLKNRYLREHFAYIRDLILRNLTYPPMAKKMGWQGKVKVSFIIREDGTVWGMKIVESSGYVVLDRNVVETLCEVQPFPKPPVRAELVIPVAYVLKS
jgi:protein TonB